MYRRADLSRTMTLVVALFWMAASTGVFARDFRAADTRNEDYPTVQALRYLGSMVAERSAGRHEIKVFHSRQPGEEKETLEQTRVDAIDLNRTNVALIGTKVPAMNVLAMPFLFRLIEHLQKALDDPIGNEIFGSFEPYGFVGLAFYDSGARSICNSVRPISAMVDLRGLRLRVQQSEQMSKMVRAPGAVPVELPYGQVPIGLSTQLIDGTENNWPSLVTTDHDELDLEQRSCKRVEAAGVRIVTDIDRKPLEAAMAGLYAKAPRAPRDGATDRTHSQGGVN